LWGLDLAADEKGRHFHLHHQGGRRCQGWGGEGSIARGEVGCTTRREVEWGKREVVGVLELLWGKGEGSGALGYGRAGADRLWEGVRVAVQ